MSPTEVHVASPFASHTCAFLTMSCNSLSVHEVYKFTRCSMQRTREHVNS